MNTKRVLVGLSGGLDSSYTAYILKEQGYDVTGIHFENGLKEDTSRPTVDLVAEFLKIPLLHLNLKEQFESLLEKVDIEMCHQQTPNICVMCAKDIKFGYVLDYALSHGFDYLATGHYVKINANDTGPVQVNMAVDETRDQSYGFSVIPNIQLRHAITPLGGLLKKEIREHALKIGLPFIQKESHGLCFTQLPFNQFYSHITKYPLINGYFKCANLELESSHQGQQLYTRGQKVMGYYVDQKLGNGDISVVTRNKLYQSRVTICQLNWHTDIQEFNPNKIYLIMIRYNADPIECQIMSWSEQSITVETAVPVYALTSGQIGAIYDDSLIVVGGYFQ
jgi:tRNA-specific 2-thiouridylase